MDLNSIKIILALGFTCFCAIGLINECLKEYKPVKKHHRKKYKPKIPYTKLIKEVVHWTSPHLREKSIKYYPKIKVTYREHRTVNGRYHSAKQTIEIFVYPSVSLKEVVKTTLHEIRHYMQHKTDPDFNQYQRFSAKLGYDKNPFEVDSRKYASKHLAECLNHLKSNNLI